MDPVLAPVEPTTAVPHQGRTEQARAAVERGIPAETRRGYAGDWQRFLTWCAETGRTLPADGDT